MYVHSCIHIYIHPCIHTCLHTHLGPSDILLQYDPNLHLFNCSICSLNLRMDFNVEGCVLDKSDVVVQWLRHLP